MPSREFIDKWKGIFLVLIGACSSLWLAASNQLQLYIHPRYVVFTTVFSAVGILIVLLVFSTKEAHQKSNLQKVSRIRSMAVTVVAVSYVLAFVVVKPAVLSSSAAIQRGINSGDYDSVVSEETTNLFNSSDYTSLSVKDWSSLLAQTSEASFFAGKSVKISGFVLADEDDPKRVLYVSRFIVSCCAVDARPVGVPVLLDDWQATYAVDQWVEVEGEFVQNTDTRSTSPLLLRPTSHRAINTPGDPYDY